MWSAQAEQQEMQEGISEKFASSLSFSSLGSAPCSM